MERDPENLSLPSAMNYESFWEFQDSLISAAVVDSKTGQLISMEFLTETEYLQMAKSKLYGQYPVAKTPLVGCESDSLLIPVCLPQEKKDQPIEFPNAEDLNFEKFKNVKESLISTSIVDTLTKRYLMTGYMNRASFNETLQIRKVVFFSRTSNSRWLKSETSGNFIRPKQITRLSPISIVVYSWLLGPICHKGTRTCFDRETYTPTPLQIGMVLDDMVKNMSSNKNL